MGFHCKSCTCDPIADLVEWNRRRDAFTAAWKYLACPSCRKRCSTKYDVVNVEREQPLVRVHCHRCGHVFDVPREPPEEKR